MDLELHPFLEPTFGPSRFSRGPFLFALGLPLAFVVFFFPSPETTFPTSSPTRSPTVPPESHSSQAQLWMTKAVRRCNRRIPSLDGHKLFLAPSLALGREINPGARCFATVGLGFAVSELVVCGGFFGRFFLFWWCVCHILSAIVKAAYAWHFLYVLLVSMSNFPWIPRYL